MNTRLTLVFSVGSLASLFIGAFAGCGTNESGLSRAGDSGAILEAGTGGSGGTAQLSPFGKACTQDSDCAKGLTCLLESSTDVLGAGPSGGVCTLDCVANGDPDCQTVDPASVCVAFDRAQTVAFCMESCAIGLVKRGQQKCHTRKDMACVPDATTGKDYCVPLCRSDADCPGRKCDLGSGFCADKLSGTLPIGTKCDRAAAVDKCTGGCLPIRSSEAGPVSSFCSAACRLGTPASCGGADDAACVYVQDQAETTGDLGFCAQLCNCDGDCRNPDFVCRLAPPQAGLPTAGDCGPKRTGSDGIPCGDAAAPPDAGKPKPKPPTDAGKG